VNTVKDVPEDFKKWITENKDRIEKAKSLPYFLRDNSVYIGNDIDLTKQAVAGIKESVSQNFSVTEIKPLSKPSEGFHAYKEFSSGGRIEIMDGYTGKSDHKDLITIARDLAEQGKTVQVTTNPHFKSEEYRRVFGALDGTVYERKCPDLIIDGVFYEYESYRPPFKKGKIPHMISKGLKQSSRIIINNNKGANHRYIHRLAFDRAVVEKQNIDEVWVYEKGKVYLLYKKQ
jgi:hypothetical protein